MLLSVAVPGLGSVLLRGQPATRTMLHLNGTALACGLLLALVRPLFLGDSDWAGWLLLAVYATASGASARLGLRDRRELAATGRVPFARRRLWLWLFGLAVLLAVAALAAAATWIVVMIGFGGPHPLPVLTAVAILVAGIFLLAAVLDVLSSFQRPA